MQYVLGLSFLFKFYRNPANVRIYSENILLDDISLDQDIKLTTFDQTKRNYNEPIEPYPGYDMLYMDNDLEKDLMDPDRFPEKLFLYTLEGEQLGQNITLEIHNDNTNYTNGFMTKYSYFVFYTCFLMPVSLLYKKYWFKPWRKKGVECWTEDFTNIQIQDGRGTWPSNLGSAVVERDNHKGHLDYRQQFGGSFKIKWPISKRFGVHYIGDKRPIGRLTQPHKFRNLMLHYNILNTENENKRNHNS